MRKPLFYSVYFGCMALLGSVFFAGTASAATYTVTTTADTLTCVKLEECSLRGAVIAANANPGDDEIIFQDLGIGTTYLLTRTAGTEYEKGDLDIAGPNALQIIGNGQGKTIIDGNAIDRVFEINPNARVKISDVTIQNGLISTQGAGIYINNAQVEISNSLIQKNRAVNTDAALYSNGGGIYISNKSDSSTGGMANPLTLVNSSVTENEAEMAGGIGAIDFVGFIIVNTTNVDANIGSGIQVTADSTGDLYLVSSSVSNNSFYGVYFQRSNIAASAPYVDVFQTTINNNGDVGFVVWNAYAWVSSNSEVNNNKSGVRCYQYCEMRFEDSTIANNTTDGGVSVTDNSYFWLKNSAVSSNSDTYWKKAGGVWLEDSEILVEGSTFSSNYSGQNGGGIYARQSTVNIHDSTFDGNRGEQHGGALVTENSPTNITDSIFLNNQAINQRGGAISNSWWTPSTTMTISGTTFSNNTANYQAGAIDNLTEGTLNISDSVFDGNSAGDSGAILNHDSSTLTVTKSTFSNNRATHSTAGEGGAIRNVDGMVTIRESIFEDNYANRSGGAVVNYTMSTTSDVTNIAVMSIDDSIFRRNYAAAGGGAIFNGAEPEHTGVHAAYTDLLITNSAFYSNFAAATNNLDVLCSETLYMGEYEAAGGGAITIGGGTTKIVNSTFSDNAANQVGGAIAVMCHGITGVTAEIVNSTIADNAADVDGVVTSYLTEETGGGLYVGIGAEVTFKNTIIAGNSNTTAPDCVVDTETNSNMLTTDAVLVSDDYNIISDTTGCDFTASTNDQLNTDPLLEALNYNGSDTLTMALSMIPPSPAIDAIPAANCTDTAGTVVTTDQRGITRSNFCDVGAFEREDAENDLMPDEWETLYSLSTAVNDAGDDSDSDGFTNYQEFVFATKPNDATSYPLDSDGDTMYDIVDVCPAEDATGYDVNSDGCIDDTDGDGVGDNSDAFPTDGAEWVDTDGDGVGDNSDVFPGDATEWFDTDGDGYGDNSDAFSTDATEWFDTDGDEVGDNADLCSGTVDHETVDADGCSLDQRDTDGDGYTDSEESNAGTDPNDANSYPTTAVDSDGDGYDDLSDAFPADATEWFDSDGDSVGDNSDAFPYDATEWFDTDADGYGDNSDAFPTNSAEWFDSDSDGVGDNSDACSDTTDYATVDSNGCSDYQRDTDSDGYSDGVESSAGTDPNDANSYPVATVDSDSDGYDDSSDAFPYDATEWFDTDADGYGDNSDAFPTDATEWFDSDSDGVGDNSDACSDTTDYVTVDSNGCSDAQRDTDGDGLTDSEEDSYGTSRTNTDTDGDTLSDGDEASIYGTNPATSDTDGDGYSDGEEVSAYTNPLDAGSHPAVFVDSDGDGINDPNDLCSGTTDYITVDTDGCSDAQRDTDGDGLNDAEEDAFGSSRTSTDSDSDGFTDYEEVYTYSTDPVDADTDGDGLSDYDEIITYATNALSIDTDSDGIEDWEEAFPGGTDPNNADTYGDGLGDLAHDSDADGLANEYESDTLGSDPNDADTDNDGWNDGDEVQYGTNVLDPAVHP